MIITPKDSIIILEPDMYGLLMQNGDTPNYECSDVTVNVDEASYSRYFGWTRTLSQKSNRDSVITSYMESPITLALKSILAYSVSNYTVPISISGK